MKYLFLVFLISSVSATELLPGLWETTSKVSINGKELDIQKQIQSAMAMMPPDQREAFKKVMKTQLGDSGMLGDMGDTKTCVTEDMVKDPLAFVKKDSDCKNKLEKDSAKQKILKITCKNGSHGTLTWNIKDAKTYDGKFEGMSQKQEKVLITLNGKHLKKDCE